MPLTKERVITEVKVLLANRYHLINVQEEIIIKDNGEEIARNTNIHHIPPTPEGKKLLENLEIDSLLNLDVVWPKVIVDSYQNYLNASKLIPGS